MQHRHGLCYCSSQQTPQQVAARVALTAARPHHQPLQRREPHAGVNRLAAFHSAHAAASTCECMQEGLSGSCWSWGSVSCALHCEPSRVSLLTELHRS